MYGHGRMHGGWGMTFDEFVAGSFERLAVYARLITRDRSEADDLLAESLLIAQRRWSRISTVEYPAAYVRKIITHQHLRQRRTWWARNVDVRPAELLPERSGRDATWRVDVRASLAFHLDQLPVRQRAAVILRYYLDLTFDEIGIELGVKAAGARTLVSRGVAGLRSTGLVDAHLQEMR